MAAVLDVRTFAGSRESIAYHDGGLFPVLSKTADDAIAAVLRGGSGHLGLHGRIDLIRSDDGGRTWSPPAVIADGPYDDRNPAFGISRKGTLILAYYVPAGYDESGKYTPELRRTSVHVMRSVDNGFTWSGPVVTSPDGFAGSPYGRIVEQANGRLLLPIYGAAERDGGLEGSFFLTSDDDGQSWDGPFLIARKHNETTLLVLPDGSLLAAMRESERSLQRLNLSRSPDGGETWSEPELITDVMQHPADLIVLRDNVVLLTYGNRQAPYRIEGRLSLDGGVTWEAPVLAFSGSLYGYDLAESRPTDLGYPTNALLNDGRVCTLYYYNPFSIHEPNEWTGPFSTRFYLSKGYRAVAVTWSIEEMLSAVAS